jgi:hypothetical protein
VFEAALIQRVEYADVLYATGAMLIAINGDIAIDAPSTWSERTVFA